MAHGNRLANLSDSSQSALADRFRLRTGTSLARRLEHPLNVLACSHELSPWRPGHRPRRAHTSPQPPAIAGATGSSDPTSATRSTVFCAPRLLNSDPWIGIHTRQGGRLKSNHSQ